MSTVVLAPREAPSLPSAREVELLRGALDEELLAELGWDPKAMVVRRCAGTELRLSRVRGARLRAAGDTRRGNVCTTC